jgi:hypothetical protein
LQGNAVILGLFADKFQLLTFFEHLTNKWSLILPLYISSAVSILQSAEEMPQ